MREKDEFLDEVSALEGEHRDFDSTIACLDVDAPGFAVTVKGLLGDLDTHVERENLGIFPVSVVTLGAAGWQTVDEAHAESPSFLLDQPSIDERSHDAERVPDRLGAASPGGRTEGVEWA